jgi:glutamate 5-kinase
VILPKGSPGSAYKQWIAGTLAPAGSVTIDEGAIRALGNGKSLLPAGVRAVAGSFDQGACLSIVSEEGRELGRGIARYASAEASQIAGMKADQIPSQLGYSRGDELIHRDDLVLL